MRPNGQSYSIGGFAATGSHARVDDRDGRRRRPTMASGDSRSGAHRWTRTWPDLLSCWTTGSTRRTTRSAAPVVEVAEPPPELRPRLGGLEFDVSAGTEDVEHMGRRGRHRTRGLGDQVEVDGRAPVGTPAIPARRGNGNHRLDLHLAPRQPRPEPPMIRQMGSCVPRRKCPTARQEEVGLCTSPGAPCRCRSASARAQGRGTRPPTSVSCAIRGGAPDRQGRHLRRRPV